MMNAISANTTYTKKQKQKVECWRNIYTFIEMNKHIVLKRMTKSLGI